MDAENVSYEFKIKHGLGDTIDVYALQDILRKNHTHFRIELNKEKSGTLSIAVEVFNNLDRYNETVVRLNSFFKKLNK